MSSEAFSERIRARFPEGLTGLFAIGATRRTYILEQQRDLDDPGHIRDFDEMTTYLYRRYLDFAAMFFDLGGQNMIISGLSYRSFFERGEEYARKVSPQVARLIDDESVAFYQEQQIDPYFIGLEVLSGNAANPVIREIVDQLHDFSAHWDYQPGRRTMFWEIATIPLLSFWQVFQAMNADERHELDARIAACPDLPSIQRTLYEHFSRAILGVPMPMPHFYLGAAMSGDLKFRSPLMLSLTGGEYLRAYYTPYPTLMLARDGLREILDDLAFGKRLHSPTAYDYSGRYSSTLVDAEYQRIQSLIDDPSVILGMRRQVDDE